MSAVQWKAGHEDSGFTLIELIVALIVLAVGILALSTTIPLLSRAGDTGDLEDQIRSARNCIETFVILENRGCIDISQAHCELDASDSTPEDWVDCGDTEETSQARNAVQQFCVDSNRGAPLNVICTHCTERGSAGGSRFHEILVSPAARPANDLVFRVPTSCS